MRDRRGLRILAYIGLAIAVALAVGALARTSTHADHAARDAKHAARDSKRAIARIEKEILSRRAQTCKFLITAHKREVDNLSGTYRYLDFAIKRGKSDDPLTQFIILLLPNTEKTARKNIVPQYCHGHFNLPKQRDYSRYFKP